MITIKFDIDFIIEFIIYCDLIDLIIRLIKSEFLIYLSLYLSFCCKNYDNLDNVIFGFEIDSKFGKILIFLLKCLSLFHLLY